jgi:selenocysteine-specific elongation factor
VTGAGAVVAGTALDGAVEVGARLVLSPRGLDVRVRGLQSGGRVVERVAAGERCAVNLASVELSSLHRGDWLVTQQMHAPVSRIEARLRVLPARDQPLKHYTPVHLHIGTSDLGARVLIAGQSAIPPGGEAVVTLALDSPTCAATGDRFVIRDRSGRVSIGGGKVIDPYVRAGRRQQTNHTPVTAALDLPAPAQALAALLAIPDYEVSTRHFERCFNLSAEAAKQLYREADAVLLTGTHALALPASRVAALRQEVIDALAEFHRNTPDADGMSVPALKAKLSRPTSAEAFLSLLRDLHEQRQVATAGALIKLSGHTTTMSAADSALWGRLLTWLEERGAAPFTAQEVARDAKTSAAAISALLHRQRVSGEIWRITEERYLLRDQVAALAARAERLSQEVGGAGFSAAQYRDAIGTGRTWAIHILEFFDAVGVTRRTGDTRKIRADYQLVVGSAAPYTPETPLRRPK